MDTNYATDLALSILIFAPGVVLLGFAFFVGVLAAVEKSGLFGRKPAPAAKELEPAKHEH